MWEISKGDTKVPCAMKLVSPKDRGSIVHHGIIHGSIEHLDIIHWHARVCV